MFFQAACVSISEPCSDPTPLSQTPHRRAALPPQSYSGELPLDFSRRILHAAFHPHQNLIAIAATSTLYIMNGS